MAGAFCVHRRVKTVCPECRPRPEPREPELPSGRAPGARPEPREAGDELAARGPGKPLTPTRRRPRKVTAEDAERAEAWWVQRE